MTISERRAIYEAYQSMAESEQFAIKVTRVYENMEGEEIDEEELLQKTFDSAEEANEFIELNYTPLDWESDWCMTEPQQNSEGYDYLRIDTIGFSFQPLEESVEVANEDADDINEDDTQQIPTNEDSGEETVTDWN